MKLKKISNGVKYPHTNFKNDYFYSENKKRSGFACRSMLSKRIGKIGRGASPNFSEEKKLWRRGYKLVAGLDEAGRGPLAGPVVAAAVLVNEQVDINFLKGINDSKKLSLKQRDHFYKILTNHKDIEWGIGIVSEKVIDKINILEASKLAMQKALQQTQDKLNGNIDYLVLDGNFKINSNIQQKSIISGDQKVISIAMASIIAKVTRDNLMQKFHKKYPQYRFNEHKGYPTELHIKMLKKFGVCPIHRKSFRPVAELIVIHS